MAKPPKSKDKDSTKNKLRLVKPSSEPVEDMPSQTDEEELDEAYSELEKENIAYLTLLETLVEIGMPASSFSGISKVLIIGLYDEENNYKIVTKHGGLSNSDILAALEIAKHIYIETLKGPNKK